MTHLTCSVFRVKGKKNEGKEERMREFVVSNGKGETLKKGDNGCSLLLQRLMSVLGMVSVCH